MARIDATHPVWMWIEENAQGWTTARMVKDGTLASLSVVRRVIAAMADAEIVKTRHSHAQLGVLQVEVRMIAVALRSATGP